MAVTLPHTFANKTLVVGSELDEQFVALQAMFAAAIRSADIASDAAILLTQLEASKEHLNVILHVDGTQLGGTWPATGVVAAVPVIGVTGATAWTATDCYWICNDTGDGVATFAVQWGEYNATGAWVNANTIATATMANANANEDANDGTATLVSGTMAVDTGPRSLALVGTGTGVGYCTAVGTFVTVVVRLKRDLTTG